MLGRDLSHVDYQKSILSHSRFYNLLNFQSKGRSCFSKMWPKVGREFTCRNYNVRIANQVVPSTDPPHENDI